MPFHRIEAEERLSPAVSKMHISVVTAKYPSPNNKKTVLTERAFLTNQKPEPRVRRLPSESTTMATPLIIYCISSMSFSGWLLSFPACHWITERHGIG
uniref:Uncharacterized protein n=1 Tax=Mesocestoides corti TaxID=53468 RepID=A0A5K3G556_MESCO